jgi:hypothetical protein
VRPTRKKLREAGIEPDISERPDLTYDEAYATLQARRQQLMEEAAIHDQEVMEAALGPPPASLRGRNCIAIRSEEDSIEVVRVRQYKKTFQKSLISHQYQKGRANAWAVLVPEPENPHDGDAVAVYIDGDKVGYLDAEIAEYLQSDLHAIEQAKGAYICCRASLSIGSKGWLNVYLDISEEDIEALAPVVPHEQATREASNPSLERDIGTISLVGCLVALGSVVFCVAVLVLAGKCMSSRTPSSTSASWPTAPEKVKIQAGETYRCNSQIQAVDARDRSRAAVFDPPTIIRVKAVHESGEIDAYISRNSGESWAVILKLSETRFVASHPGCDHLCARNPASPCRDDAGLMKCDPSRDHSRLEVAGVVRSNASNNIHKKKQNALNESQHFLGHSVGCFEVR